MNFRTLILAMVFAAVPAIAMAQTPKMDKEADAIKEYLWKKGLRRAPTDIHLAALSALRVEVCGARPETSMSQFHLQMAALQAPASVIETWYLRMKRKMKTALKANPAEAVAFCR